MTRALEVGDKVIVLACSPRSQPSDDMKKLVGREGVVSFIWDNHDVDGEFSAVCVHFPGVERNRVLAVKGEELWDWWWHPDDLDYAGPGITLDDAMAILADMQKVEET